MPESAPKSRVLDFQSLAEAPSFWFWVRDDSGADFEFGGMIVAREKLLVADVVNARGGTVPRPS